MLSSAPSPSSSSPQISDFKVANGISLEPGYNVLRGADLVGSMGALRHPFHPPIALLNSFYYVVGDGVLRFFLTRETHFNSLTFDTRSAGPNGRWVPGIMKQSEEDDSSLADLTAFERHGGKLLLVHGTADTTIPTDASVFLYQRIAQAMGQARTEGFARLYLIPGFGHGRGTFDAGFDSIGTLDQWADRNISPTQLTVTDNNKQNASRTRPLCPWPEWPAYTSGDPDLATSFTCKEGSTEPFAPKAH